MGALRLYIEKGKPHSGRGSKYCYKNLLDIPTERRLRRKNSWLVRWPDDDDDISWNALTDSKMNSNQDVLFKIVKTITLKPLMVFFLIGWDSIEYLQNLMTALKLFMTVCVSVASHAISFSKVKLPKNYLYVTQSRLRNLGILAIKHQPGTGCHQI